MKKKRLLDKCPQNYSFNAHKDEIEAHSNKEIHQKLHKNQHSFCFMVNFLINILCCHFSNTLPFHAESLSSQLLGTNIHRTNKAVRQFHIQPFTKVSPTNCLFLKEKTVRILNAGNATKSNNLINKCEF